MDVLKPIKDDPDNPFGSLIKEGVNDPDNPTTERGGQSYYSVSYTHLDVYKRQELLRVLLGSWV